MPETRTNPRRFLLVRNQDVTGVSGTGVVAEGVLFTNDVIALQWTSEFPTSVVFHQRGLESVEAVHLHNGATVVQWLDDETEPDLAELVYEAVGRALVDANKAETKPRRKTQPAGAQETPAAEPEPGPTPPEPTARIGGRVRQALAQSPAPDQGLPGDEPVEEPNSAAQEPAPDDPEDDPRRDDEVRAAEELAGRSLVPPGMPPPTGEDYSCRECGVVISRIQAIKTWTRFREFLCQGDFAEWGN